MHFSMASTLYQGVYKGFKTLKPYTPIPLQVELRPTLFIKDILFYIITVVRGGACAAVHAVPAEPFFTQGVTLYTTVPHPICPLH